MKMLGAIAVGLVLAGYGGVPAALAADEPVLAAWEEPLETATAWKEEALPPVDPPQEIVGEENPELVLDGAA